MGRGSSSKREVTEQTYRDDNFRCISLLRKWLTSPVSADIEQFLEGDGAATGIRNLVADNRASNLRNEVHEGLAVLDGKVNVARTAAGLDRHGRQGFDGQVGRSDGVQPDQVGAEVGDEDEFACRVEEGLVRVRSVLTIGDGAGVVQLVGFRLDEGEVFGVGDVPCCKGGAAAINREVSTMAQISLNCVMVGTIPVRWSKR